MKPACFCIFVVNGKLFYHNIPAPPAKMLQQAQNKRQEYTFETSQSLAY